MNKFCGIISIILLLTIFQAIEYSIADENGAIDTWEKLINFNKNHPSAYENACVFYFAFGSEFKLPDLNYNEFILGDALDFIMIHILAENPENYGCKPENITIISPSNDPLKTNFTYVGNSYYALNLNTTLNEPGLWSIKLNFTDDSIDKFIFLESTNLDKKNDTISLYTGIKMNVYTNLEYQQMKAAKALEESAKVSKDATRWSKISTWALIFAAIIAFSSLIGQLYLHYDKINWDKEKEGLNRKIKCKEKVGNSLMLFDSTLSRLITNYDYIRRNGEIIEQDRDEIKKHHDVLRDTMCKVNFKMQH